MPRSRYSSWVKGVPSACQRYDMDGSENLPLAASICSGVRVSPSSMGISSTSPVLRLTIFLVAILTPPLRSKREIGLTLGKVVLHGVDLHDRPFLKPACIDSRIPHPVGHFLFIVSVWRRLQACRVA